MSPAPIRRPPSVAGSAWRAPAVLGAADLEDVLAAEFRREVGGDQRVVGVVVGGRDGDAVADDKLDAVFGGFRQDIAEEGLDPRLAGAAQVAVIGIGHQNRHLGLFQRLGKPAVQRDPPTRARRASSPPASPSAARDGHQREAVQHHGGGDQREGQRSDQRAVRDPERGQPVAEQPGHRDEHDAARAGEGDEQALARRQRRCRRQRQARP